MNAGETREKILAYGHANIQADHPSTLMFTKEKHLSKAGDCIVAIAANKAVNDLSKEFKRLLKKPNSKLMAIIEANGLVETIKAFGSPKLILTNSNDIVIRKSNYISDRTIAVNADKSSEDLSRELVKKLRCPGERVEITLIVNV